MLLPDVNVLVYAHRRDSIRNHAEYADWICGLATGPEPFALSVLVLSGLVRVVTNPRIFSPPSALDEVFVAIEHGCTMVSTDSDFDRFPGLRWQHPLRP